MITCVLCLFPVRTEFLYGIAALHLTYPAAPWRFKLFCAPPNTTGDAFLSPAGIPKSASAYEADVEASFNASGVYVSESSQTVFHCCLGTERGTNCSVLASKTEGKMLASAVKALVFRQLGKYFHVPSLHCCVIPVSVKMF